MNLIQKLRAQTRVVPFLFVLLGSAAATYAATQLVGHGDCCATGAACCKPGAACCNHSH